MKRISNIFRHSLLALFALAVCAGCHKEGEEVVVVENKNVMLEVSVSTDKVTRSASTTTEQLINSLRIYAFLGEECIGYIYHDTALDEDESLYIDLNLPETGTYDVDLYVVANETEMAYDNQPVVLTPDLNKAELEAIKFTGPLTQGPLPMYCKHTETIDVDNISEVANTGMGHEGHLLLSQKAILELSRSLSKLTVYAAKSEGMTDNPQILSTTLLAQGTREYSYLFPQTDEVLNAVASRTDNHILFSSGATISKSIDKSDTEARENCANYDEVFTDVYLPEVVYGSSDWTTTSGNEREAVLHIEYTRGEGKALQNAYVYMPPIKRNHHIKVCILINAEGQIIITYTVAPWDDNPEEVYTFAYPTHSYLRQSIPTTQEESLAQPSQSARMSETTPFIGYFQMSAPTSDYWTPTLLGLNANNCSIRVYEGATSISVPESSFPIVASDTWYRIEVHPADGKLDAGDEVQLAITYTATGLESREFLLINGGHQSYYWPYEGTSLQDANYVIITMVN